MHAYLSIHLFFSSLSFLDIAFRYHVELAYLDERRGASLNKRWKPFATNMDMIPDPYRPRL